MNYTIWVILLMCSSVFAAEVYIPPNSSNLQSFFNLANNGDTVVISGSQTNVAGITLTHSIMILGNSSATITCSAASLFTAAGVHLDISNVNFINCDRILQITDSSATMLQLSSTSSPTDFLQGIIFLQNSSLSLSRFSSANLVTLRANYSTVTFYDSFVSFLHIITTNSRVELIGLEVDTNYKLLNAQGGSVLVENSNVIARGIPAILQLVSLRATVRNCTFTCQQLGAILLLSSNATIEDVTISGGAQTEMLFGAAVQIFQSSVVMKNCIIQNTSGSFNTMYWNGAAVSFFNATVYVINCQIRRNTCTTCSGPGLRVTAGRVEISHTLFEGNSGPSGGAVFAENAEITFHNCTYKDNQASGPGGAVYLTAGSNLVFSDCSITNNTAQIGGGIASANGSVSLYSSEISRNIASVEGGGIWTSGRFTSVSSIIVDNTASINRAVAINSSSVFVIIRDTRIEESAFSGLPSEYCCNNVSSTIINDVVCNYPTCGPTCLNRVSCSCPFYLSAPFPTPLPFIEEADVNCSCEVQYSGYLCNVYHNCSNNCTKFEVCRDRGQGYQCYCAPGYEGPACSTDINECERKTANCSAIGSMCNNTIGSYNCSCITGFSGNGFICDDVNECLADRCDPRVECDNSIGSFSCDECPFGYSGDGFTCTPLCGNGTCDAALGENCVSCSLDCGAGTCDACGDGACNGRETCATCLQDCQSTCATHCETCKNGYCALGSCVCNAGWSGPACDALPQPITVTPSNSTARVSVVSARNDHSSPNKETTVSFGISVTNITEIGTEGISFDMQQAVYNISHSYVANASARYEIWAYSTTLRNKAHVNVTFLQFQDSSLYTINSDTIIPFPNNTLKVNVRISNWPFKSIKNLLQIGFHINADISGKERVCNYSRSNGFSLDYTKISFAGSTIYSKFQSNATLDNRNFVVKFSTIDIFTVIATVPHFWQFAELDPNYVVLIDPTACSTLRANNLSTQLILAIVIPIVGVAFLVAIGYYIYLRINKKTRKKRRRKLNNQEFGDEAKSTDMINLNSS